MQDELLTPWNAEQWLWLFQQPYCDYHMLRKQVYAYTVQAAMKGSYDIFQTDPKTRKTQTKTVTLSLDPDIAKHTKMYRSKQNPPVRNRYEKTEFKVLAQDCLAVAKNFVEQKLSHGPEPRRHLFPQCYCVPRHGRRRVSVH